MSRALLQILPSLVCACAASALTVWLGLAAHALGIAAGGVVLIWGLCISHWVAQHRNRSEQVVARRFLELLAHSQEPGLAPIFNAESLPAIDERSPWFGPLTKIRDFLASFHDRQANLQSNKTGLEIRLQRTLSKLELASTVLSKIGDPVLALDRYDDLLLCNAEAESLLETHGEKRRIAGGQVGDKLTAMVTDVRRRLVASHRTEEFETVDADGRKRWYRATVDNLRDRVTPATEEVGAVVVLRDVTAQHAIQQQHAEFVSAASHEMKTPLAGIKAYVELLADGDAESEEEREEFLDVINGQADRLQRMIENLLNIARIEAGVVKVSKQPRSVNEIAAEALEVIRPGAEMKQISLVSELSPLYLGALVDRDMLSQAIINLLSNAVKYTPSEGRVTLRTRMSGDHEIAIEVEDTGVGLSEEDCVRVFEKFYRVEKDKSMAGGTGLGLALAQHITEDVHGGKLSVRSKLGEGSTFSIIIPSAGRSA